MVLTGPTLPQAQSETGCDLKLSSIAHLLFELLHAKLSGILSIQADKVVRRIAFRDGTPTTATSNVRAETLGPLLLRLGKISEPESQKLQTLMTPQQTPVTMLEALGRFTAVEIQKLVDLVQVERLRLLFSIRDGVAKFATAPPTAPVIANFMRAYLDGITAFYDEARISATFAELAPNHCVLYQSEPFYQWEKLLLPEERGLAMVASTSATVAEIIAQSLLTPKEKQQGLAKISLLQIVKFESSGVKEERQLLETLTPEQRTLRQSADKLLADDQAGRLNYFTLFNIQPNASRSEVDNAFKSLSQRYHRNALEPLFIAAEQGRIAEIAKLLQQIQQILLNENKRAEYAEFIASGKSGRFEGQSKVLAVEKAVDEGSQLFEKKRYIEAYNVFHQALKNHARDPRLLAWAGYCYTFSGQPKEKGLELIKGANKLDPRCPDALLFLGELALKDGESENGQQWLKQLLLIDPKNSRAKSLLSSVDGGMSLKVEIEAIYSNLNSLDYYALLDTTLGTRSNEIQRAYHRKTKQFHPDRFFTHADLDLKEKARVLYKRCVEAYMVLKNPMKRKEYDEQRAKAKQGEAQVRLKDASEVMQKKERFEQPIKNPQAKKYFGLGMTSLQMGNLSGAIMNFQLALNSEPNHPLISQRLQETRDKAKE